MSDGTPPNDYYSMPSRCMIRDARHHSPVDRLRHRDIVMHPDLPPIRGVPPGPIFFIFLRHPAAQDAGDAARPSSTAADEAAQARHRAIGNLNQLSELMVAAVAALRGFFTARSRSPSAPGPGLHGLAQQLLSVRVPRRLGRSGLPPDGVRDEKGAEGREGGQDQAHLSGNKLPVHGPDAVHDAAIFEAAGADQRDGDQDDCQA